MQLQNPFPNPKMRNLQNMTSPGAYPNTSWAVTPPPTKNVPTRPVQPAQLPKLTEDEIRHEELKEASKMTKKELREWFRDQVKELESESSES